MMLCCAPSRRRWFKVATVGAGLVAANYALASVVGPWFLGEDVFPWTLHLYFAVAFFAWAWLCLVGFSLLHSDFVGSKRAS